MQLLRLGVAPAVRKGALPLGPIGPHPGVFGQDESAEAEFAG